MTRRSHWRDTVSDSLLVMLGSALAIWPAAATASEVYSEHPVVQTEAGPVQGVEHDGVNVFTAVPYAAPPVGSNRFQPPQQRTPWTGVLDATGESPACPQSEPSAIGKISVDEDCLYLNVWAPAGRADAKQPVMVWIHGSGTSGYGGSPYFSGFHLAHDNGIVFVTINYRLGLLGSLVSTSLDAPDGTHRSGDYWLLDQQAALRWVKSNIARFGGDPATVTVMGESSGGASVLALLASPRSKGLFQRAIVESEGDAEPVVRPTGLNGGDNEQMRSAPQLLSRADAQHYTHVVVLPAVGCANAKDVAACLRAAPVFAFLGPFNSYMRVENPGLLPRDPFAAFHSGHFNRVPVLIGSNAEEGHFMSALLEKSLGRRLNADDYRAFVTAYWPDPAKALELYPVDRFSSPAAAHSRLVTDLAFACPADLARRELSAFTQVYGYEFSEPDPVQKEPLPSITELPNAPYHTSEESYVFDGDEVYAPLSGRAATLSKTIRAYWASFARTGDPNGEQRPTWLQFDAHNPAILELQSDPRMSGAFAADHNCKGLEAAGLIGGKTK